MSALKKSEAKRLLFEIVVIFLVVVVFESIWRDRGRGVHQILIDSFPYVLGATIVNVWNSIRRVRSVRTK